MKAVLCIALLAVVAGLSGCDSMSYRQYVIRSASPADEKAVAAALFTAANAAGLKESTNESLVPRTVAYYKEPVEHFPVSLGARVADQDVVIDLSCFHPGPPSSTPAAFKAIDSVLSRELPNIFGARLQVDPKPPILFPKREEASEFKIEVHQPPNKAVQPTPGSVTPRATEGTSK